ncbi:hypothetical protein D3C81_927760 [compost metagenome]
MSISSKSAIAIFTYWLRKHCCMLRLPGVAEIRLTSHLSESGSPRIGSHSRGISLNKLTPENSGSALWISVLCSGAVRDFILFCIFKASLHVLNFTWGLFPLAQAAKFIRSPFTPFIRDSILSTGVTSGALSIAKQTPNARSSIW